MCAYSMRISVAGQALHNKAIKKESWSTDMTPLFRNSFLLLAFAPALWGVVLGIFDAHPAPQHSALASTVVLLFLHSLPVALLYFAACLVKHLAMTAVCLMIVSWCTYWFCDLTGNLGAIVPAILEWAGGGLMLAIALLVFVFRKLQSANT